MSDGSIVNVLSELELEGDEDICIQELKLLEDNANEPEQDVFDVLVVIEVLSIASEKVTEMLSLIETPLWLSLGEIEETVGAVVSVVVVLSSLVVSSVVVVVLSVLFEPSSLLLLQEMMVELKRRKRERMMSICLTRFPNCLVLGEPNI